MDEGRYSEEEKEKVMMNLLESYENVMSENKELKEMNQRDSQTGLYNSDKFYEDLKTSVSRADRFEEEISLVVLDLDNFKAVNDIYGHCKGDEVIGKVADKLSSDSRDYDKAFRYGGDEFTVILEGIDEDETLNFVERIYDDILSDEVWEGVDRDMVDYDVSIGIASYDGGSEVNKESISKALTHMADKAMYNSKESYQNKASIARYNNMFFRAFGTEESFGDENLPLDFEEVNIGEETVEYQGNLSTHTA